MFLIYDLIFLLFIILYLPLFLFKGKAHKGFRQRLGYFSKDLNESFKNKNNIWVHAVSVGEVTVVAGLLNFLRKLYPKDRIIISTVTPTGNKLAKSIRSPDDLIIYFPLDLSFIVKKFVKKIKPKIFISAETEIWPNLFLALYKENVPVILVNGRVSDASFRGYRIVKPLIRNILRGVKLFCMQTQMDAQRIKELGANIETIVVAGNMKFDTTSPSSKYSKENLGFLDSDLLLIAGSTHNGEEEIILKVYKNLSKEFMNLKLLIAPRHIERCRFVESILIREGIKFVRFSKGLNKLAQANVVILDTIGDLNSLYALADVIFMGGSLIKKGGHNIIEPALFGKPVIFGPYMFNFKEISRIFLKRNAAIKINNPEDLETNIRDLLLHKESREKIGKIAASIVEENRGATEKTARIIEESIFKKNAQRIFL
ncbi:MAG: 3-deoxy-D-manno-octulosonic acid transferase [Candidatus Omnitrophota bacterium]|nr:3-deoxy-D-manno-octulosonic acid transferase [Candidatus Omnitrophota bacterium]